MLGYFYNRFLVKIRGSALRRASIHKTSKVESGSTIINTRFDRHTFCGYDCLFQNVDVGAFTSIASRVVVGGAAHPMHFVSTSPVFLSHRDSVRTKFSRFEYSDIPQTNIGNDVWIGEGAFIKAGVSIGDGAVIGMGSVVTKDVPSYAVHAGNPAKFIRMRFGKEIVDSMVRIRWWDFDDERLRHLAQFFDDPVRFVYEAENLS